MLLSRSTIPAPALLARLTTPPRVVVARAAAVTALVLLFSASAAIVMAGSGRSPLAPGDASFITARLVAVDQGVRTQLVRLESTGGIVRAQRATRETVAALSSLQRSVRDTRDSRSARLRAAIADELRFLDAVGSVLMNRASPKLALLAPLDAAARRSLAALPGPAARREGGVGALRRWRGAA